MKLRLRLLGFFGGHEEQMSSLNQTEAEEEINVQLNVNQTGKVKVETKELSV